MWWFIAWIWISLGIGVWVRSGGESMPMTLVYVLAWPLALFVAFGSRGSLWRLAWRAANRRR